MARLEGLARLEGQPCACPTCSALGRDTHGEQQDWWHDEPEDPHAGLTLLSMALWVLILIPLHQAWIAIKSKFPNRPAAYPAL